MPQNTPLDNIGLAQNDFMSTVTTFRDLKVGDRFDWIDDSEPCAHRCVKSSALTYKNTTIDQKWALAHLVRYIDTPVQNIERS